VARSGSVCTSCSTPDSKSPSPGSGPSCSNYKY
jgi:hypothetical protein